MQSRKPSWAKTKVDWECRKKIYELWAQNKIESGIVRFFELHAGDYEKPPFNRDTIRKVQDELNGMDIYTVRKLIKECPDIKGFILDKRPDLLDYIDQSKPAVNWIEDHIANNGKPPIAEAWMLELLPNYAPNQLLDKTTEWIYPSTQYWNGKLLPSQREKWLQFIEWQGGNREDFLEEMRRRAPPGGESRELKRKR